MNHELLPVVDSTLQSLMRDLERRSADAPTYEIHGEATTGKTSLLLSLRQELATGTRRPVLVSPPAEAPEVGLLALLELHGELETAGMSTQEISARVREPGVSWSDKIGVTRELLRDNEDKLVLLLDEPARWHGGGADTPELVRHAEDIASLLVNYARCPRILTGPIRQGAADRRYQLSPGTEIPKSSPGFWGRLAATAEALVRSAPEAISRRTPLELRLLVALSHMEGASEIARWLTSGSTGPTRREIAARLKHALARKQDTARVVQMWGQLALERRPFDSELLRTLGHESLSPEARDLVSIGLLYEERDGFVLHEMLRSDAALDGVESRRATHAVLAHYHRRRFEDLSRAPRIDHRAVLVHEAECVHHTIHTGDIEAVKGLRVFFVDQLNLLGRTLSRDFRRYADAVTVYQRVLEYEKENAYATHYTAFNLDVQGLDQKTVTAMYARSLELDGTVDRWHAHWIGFLITRGRTREARVAWDRALDQLMVHEIAVRDELYVHLHEPVLRLLLHRAVLDFARSVLESVPRRLRQAMPTFGAMERRLAGLELSIQQLAVFPLRIPPSEWWTRGGPHLCPWRYHGEPLVRWLAARVDAVDREQQTLTLLTAAPPATPGQSPVVGRMNVAFDKFDRWTENEKAADLAPGRFLELAVYQDKGEPLMCCRVHPIAADLESDLPPLWPPPDRYVTSSSSASDSP